MRNRALAILWAQWRSVRNRFPRGNRVGAAFTAVMMAVWYGGFTLLAISAAVLMANPAQLQRIGTVLPAGLLACFVYWQAMPVVMASMGSSLDIKKLLAYPVPNRELFALEVLLRITTGIEVVIVLLGAGIGLLLNPRIPVWAPLGLLPFLLFNLFVSEAVRELLKRMLSRKYVRELAAIVFLSSDGRVAASVDRYRQGTLVCAAVLGQAIPVLAGAPPLNSFRAIARPWWLWRLFAWPVASYFVGRWQFENSLRFDADKGNARSGAPQHAGLLDSLYRLPGRLLTDPLGAAVEKELRSLARSARFRLVFLMGFSFGLLIWLPGVFGRTGDPTSFMGRNYLTCISVYALLLLSDLLFWNSFGLDRWAAQIYFVIPVRLSRILMAKNIAAMLFVLIEITAIILVCASIRLPMTAGKFWRHIWCPW